MSGVIGHAMVAILGAHEAKRDGCAIVSPIFRLSRGVGDDRTRGRSVVPRRWSADSRVGPAVRLTFRCNAFRR